MTNDPRRRDVLRCRGPTGATVGFPKTTPSVECPSKNRFFSYLQGYVSGNRPTVQINRTFRRRTAPKGSVLSRLSKCPLAGTEVCVRKVEVCRSCNGNTSPAPRRRRHRRLVLLVRRPRER